MILSFHLFGMLQDRMTRLIMACDHGRMDIVNELINHGTDVNEKDGVSCILDNYIVFDYRFDVFGMLRLHSCGHVTMVIWTL